MTDTDAAAQAETDQPAANDKSAGEANVEVTRREFMNIAWLASLGFFLVPFGGATILFAFPRFKEGEFGGTFRLTLADIPEINAGPNVNTRGKFWITRTEDGVRAIYKVCTHLGCLYNWQESDDKFICPCHGSQFERDSTWILGPAPRSLDLFNLQAIGPDGTELAATPGPNAAVPVFDDDPGVVYIVDTGNRIDGAQHE
ncbi:MAG TPA: ubiquinol-cytochrome c reductase iron-sulfur subunit [Anaerolineales bacterium]|nr:ubiquinol-cytochrome c reductase iron-sulfur subunit [Anaerolineales bacterium]